MATIADVFARTRFVPDRAQINPLDKCTVVSAYCKPIDTWKATITPGHFIVPAAADGDISVLVVGTSSWWKEIDPDQPPTEMVVPSMQIAESIINDFCNGLLGCDMNEKMPAFFFIPGPANMKSVDQFTPADYTLLKATIKKEHADKIEKALAKQNRWYQELILIGDVNWARTNGNPLSVPDDSRIAANKLGLKNKPWMQDFTSFQMEACPACGNLRNPAYPICSSCKTIVDHKKYAELGLKQVV